MVAIVLHQISLTTSSGDRNATAFDCALIKRSKSVDSSVLSQRKKTKKLWGLEGIGIQSKNITMCNIMRLLKFQNLDYKAQELAIKSEGWSRSLLLRNLLL